MRVTNKILMNQVLRDLYANSLRTMRYEEQISTGQIIQRPSGDALIANTSINYQSVLERMTQFKRNISTGKSFLGLADASLDEVGNILRRAREIGVNMANDTNTAQIRASVAEEVNQLLQQLMQLANRRFRGRYVFAGHNTDTAPFSITPDGVLYTGDDEDIDLFLGELARTRVNITGEDAFGGLSTTIAGTVDLDPWINVNTGTATKLADLNAGNGVASGSIRLVYSGGPVTVDLSEAENLGDVRDLVQDATGGMVTVSISPANGLRLTDGGGGPITVQEVNNNTTARDLGILGASVGPVHNGADLNPLVTAFTLVADLRNGGGLPVDVANGFVVTNGTASYTVTAADMAGTVGDLISIINTQPGLNVKAEIAADGRRLEIHSRLNGATLSVAENGGTSAADLGVASAGVRADNLFTALIDLRDALLTNNQPGIVAATAAIDRATDRVLDARAEIGGRYNRLEMHDLRLDDESANVERLLSETLDVDYAEAIMNLQSAQIVLEAALRASAQILPLSLANFL
jgi:flagellar hook-associated protein 3 FlgL